MASPTLPNRVDLIAGVRDVLNEAATSRSSGPDPDLALEDGLAAGAALEAAEAFLEQEMRGNTGSHPGIKLRPFSEDQLALEGESDAEPLDEDELNSIIEHELAQSLGSQSDEMEGDRGKAMDYYFGRPRGDEKAGRSRLQSLDVADMVESELAQLLPAFIDGMTISFDTAASDQQQAMIADEESIVVDHVVQNENDGFTMFYSTLKDALLLKNCLAKVTLDESWDVAIEEHLGVPAQGLMLLQQPRGPRERVVMENVSQTGPGTFDVTVKRVTKQRKIKVEAVPPDEVRINSDHNAPTLENARFVSHSRVMRESELIAMGFDAETVEDLSIFSSYTSTLDWSRSQYATETETDESNRHDRPIGVHECWMLVDFDGDGLAERRKVLRADDGTILENKPINYMGMVSGVVYINPHKWVGISLYDKLKNVQDFKTHFLRQGADNANVSNNGRFWFIKGQVNEDHLFNSKPGGGVAVKRESSLGPMAVPNVMPAITELLAYGDKMRTERAGASLDMQSQQVPLQNRTAHGAERVISSMEQITALVASTYARTLVKGVYLTVHQLLREYFPNGYAVPHQGGRMQAMPGQWQPRQQMTLKLGLSIGERLKLSGALQATVDQQVALLEKGFGGSLVTEATLYRALMDLARMAGVPNPEQYFVNPASPEGQQAAQGKAQQAQQQQQQQQQAQQQVIDLQREVIEAQEQSKRMAATLKRQTDEEKIREDRRQHTEDIATELTEMELKYEQDVPGSEV